MFVLAAKVGWTFRKKGVEPLVKIPRCRETTLGRNGRYRLIGCEKQFDRMLDSEIIEQIV
ncbi:hypothetical protein D3C81_1675930 [compost metagenome]